MRKKEIGSEFWDVPISDQANHVFPNHTQWFISGRSALCEIIKHLKNCHSVSMPSWCCESMIKPFFDAGFEIKFYPVYWEGCLKIKFDFDCDVLFIINYFGFANYFYNLKEYEGIIIRDVTHSIFSYNFTDADYYFGSLRKWCGVYTGGYLWSNDGHTLHTPKTVNTEYVQMRKQAMELKKCYIENEHETDKSFFDIFAKAEEYLNHDIISAASSRDINIAEKLDINFLRTMRQANAEILRKAFRDWLIFPDMYLTDCPLFVPILVPDGRRDALRKYLISNNVFCPIHWPKSCYHKLDEATEELYLRELSLVCDQRYSEEDMYRIIELVNIFMEE